MGKRGVRLRMVREDWAGLPSCLVPEGYEIRTFQSGDEAAWIDIHRRSDQFNHFPAERFPAEFGRDIEVLAARQFFLVSPHGAPVGTATAWWDSSFREGDWGLVHWVAIVPEEQGKGLSKPLLSLVCRRLEELGHSRALLRTSSLRPAAVCLYWKFGFRPAPGSPEEETAWERLREDLKLGG